MSARKTVDVDTTEFFLLVEDGFYLLTEDGGRIFLSDAVLDVETYVATAKSRDYSLRAPKRTEERATVDVDTTEFFLTINDEGDYLLTEDGGRLFLSDAILDAATYVITAPYRDYTLTAPEPKGEK